MIKTRRRRDKNQWQRPPNARAEAEARRKTRAAASDEKSPRKETGGQAGPSPRAMATGKKTALFPTFNRHLAAVLAVVDQVVDHRRVCKRGCIAQMEKSSSAIFRKCAA